MPLRVRALDQRARRRAERVDDQLDRVLERDVDHPRAFGRRERELADHRLHDLLGLGRGQRRDAGLVEQVPDEVALRLREEVLGVELVVAEVLVARRVEDVDAVRACRRCARRSSASSSWTRSALIRAMPSTPRPPAFETSTTTSRQCENAKIGTSIPNISQRRLFMPAPGRADAGVGAAVLFTSMDESSALVISVSSAKTLTRGRVVAFGPSPHGSEPHERQHAPGRTPAPLPRQGRAASSSCRSLASRRRRRPPTKSCCASRRRRSIRPTSACCSAPPT